MTRWTTKEAKKFWRAVELGMLLDGYNSIDCAKCAFQAKRYDAGRRETVRQRNDAVCHLIEAHHEDFKTAGLSDFSNV